MVLHRRLRVLLPTAVAVLLTLAALAGDVVAQADPASPRRETEQEAPVSRLRHLMLPDSDHEYTLTASRDRYLDRDLGPLS